MPTMYEHDLTANGGIVTRAGTLYVSLFTSLDGTALPSANDPDGRFLFKGAPQIIEEIENEPAVIGIGEVDVELREDYLHYSEGFWFKVLKGEETQIRFYLDEGSGKTFLFWGFTTKGLVGFSELVVQDMNGDGIDDKFRRSGSLTLYSMLKKIENASVADICTEIKNTAVEYERIGDAFAGNYYKIVSISEIIGCIYKVAFGSSSVDATLGNTTKLPSTNTDIQVYHWDVGGYAVPQWYNLNNFYIATRDQYATPTTNPYLDSTHADYWANYYKNGKELLGALCRNLAILPRYFYGKQDGSLDNATPSNNKHRCEILQRGRATSSYLTFPYALKSSRIRLQSEMAAAKFRVQLRTAATNDEFDGTTLLVEFMGYGGSYWSLNFCVRVFDVPNGVWKMDFAVDIHVWDYVAAAYDNTANFYSLLTKYYVNRFVTLGRMFEREYRGIKGTEGAVVSHRVVAPMKRTQIADGAQTKAFFANQVRKDIGANALFVQWIEE